jgi:hypothetical protein
MLELQQPAVAHAEEYLYAYFYFGSQTQGAIPDLDQKIKTLAIGTTSRDHRYLKDRSLPRHRRSDH